MQYFLPLHWANIPICEGYNGDGFPFASNKFHFVGFVFSMAVDNYAHIAARKVKFINVVG